jgi:Tfp pilus assembly protein PilO
MSTSPKIIPFPILLRLFPRAVALLGRIIALRAAKWKTRSERRPAAV